LSSCEYVAPATLPAAADAHVLSALCRFFCFCTAAGRPLLALHSDYVTNWTNCHHWCENCTFCSEFLQLRNRLLQFVPFVIIRNLMFLRVYVELGRGVGGL
jgi:hypothetical protein